MPSYIELDKQGSFPPSSDVGKVIFGVATNGSATLTNVNGETTPIGGSGGTGLYIPKPIIYASQNSGNNFDHNYNQDISSIGDGNGLPGSIQNSWDSNGLKLTYDTKDDTFLNYNPKYFLFVYQGSKKQSKASEDHPNNRLNGKYGKYFIHPASFSGGTNVSTYSNFSGSEIDFDRYSETFVEFTSEWDVTPGKGKETLLNNFNPLRFYNSFINDTNNPGLRGQEFFPIRVDDCIGQLTTNKVSVTTVKGFRKYVTQRTTPVVTYVKPRLNLHIKFAIVINDPNNVGRYLIGPMSESMKIFPKGGYFYDDINTNDTFKYYYTWTWKFE